MTAVDVAALTGLSVASVYRGLRAGEIPCVRVGARYVIYRPRVEAWLAGDDQPPRRLRAVS